MSDRDVDPVGSLWASRVAIAVTASATPTHMATTGSSPMSRMASARSGLARDPEGDEPFADLTSSTSFYLSFVL